jgi:hypothetical protein
VNEVVQFVVALAIGAGVIAALFALVLLAWVDSIEDGDDLP